MESTRQVRIFFTQQLSILSHRIRFSIRIIRRRDSFPFREIDELCPACPETGVFAKRHVEVVEVVPDQADVDEDYHAVIEGSAAGWVDVGVDVSAETVFLFDESDAVAKLLQADGGVGA